MASAKKDQRSNTRPMYCAVKAEVAGLRAVNCLPPPPQPGHQRGVGAAVVRLRAEVGVEGLPLAAGPHQAQAELRPVAGELGPLHRKAGGAAAGEGGGEGGVVEIAELVGPDQAWLDAQVAGALEQAGTEVTVQGIASLPGDDVEVEGVGTALRVGRMVQAVKVIASAEPTPAIEPLLTIARLPPTTPAPFAPAASAEPPELAAPPVPRTPPTKDPELFSVPLPVK